MWQTLREAWYPRGLEVVTVALDTGGLEAAGRWIERANPQHPALIDQAHGMDEWFGIVNVPSGLWVDEDGMIVRPPETAYPRRPAFLDRDVPADSTSQQAALIQTVKKLRIDGERYVAAVNDWLTNGKHSRYVLSPDEVIQRSRPRPIEEALAAAHFELAQHLFRAGQHEAAVTHFREAYRLHPNNWTYKRQAWSLLPKDQTPLEVYGGDWLSDVRKLGAENYYPALEMSA